MRAADRSVAQTGVVQRAGCGRRRSLKEEEEEEEGVGHKHSSDNRGVWVINDSGAGSL